MNSEINLEQQITKLEKENEILIKQFDKLDNRTNTFLSISLGVFSLQMTLLTGNIINIYNNHLIKEEIYIIPLITIFFILNILFNLNSIVNFRRSSKISEELFTNIKKNKDINKNNNEETLLKNEKIEYTEHIQKNKKQINYKKRYINNGLNNIIISLTLIAIIVGIIFIMEV